MKLKGKSYYKNNVILKFFIFMKSNYFSEKKNLCNFSCFETYN